MLDTFVTTTFVKTEQNVVTSNSNDDPETILKDLYRQEPMLLSTDNLTSRIEMEKHKKYTFSSIKYIKEPLRLHSQYSGAETERTKLDGLSLS